MSKPAHTRRRSAAALAGRSSHPLPESSRPNGGDDDIIIASDHIVDMLEHDLVRRLRELLASPGATTPETISPQRLELCRLGRGVRYQLTEREGRGYWDFYMPSDHLLISVTDAVYRKDAWVRVEGASFFKLRLLLSGELRAASGQTIVQAPQAMLRVSQGSSSEGYFIAADKPIQMIVLHCRPALLTRVLGLDASDIPPPFDTLLVAGSLSDSRRMAFRPELMHPARRIIDSRHDLPAWLRGRYLEALGTEIVVQVLGDLWHQKALRTDGKTLTPRDLHCVCAARDYLSRHFAKPPRIPELARMVGINQTKLKTAFRLVIRMTIYDYIVRCRMERASEMLMSGAYTVAEVAYNVGYSYPANFTHAFKKFHGRLPRASRKVPAAAVASQ